ncbi:DUF2142 domain-containing protein [Nocardioides sp. YIM 152315]|uniref:DUF2142 domain-containing protein n=1 Tax=Nocardioides sp. YIM 152315 TaxID=3031760 RepID=UPI0023DAB45D|nr:DUF2142 domain-containing protein [Nocardioides sp. YIM 152315]MDF1605227.1 DUF2142 domain-containing protein [Nocardioides sp. YIM 152315]
MKRTEWLVALAVAVGVVLCGGAWALSSPVGSSPDDSYHMTSIWCVGASETSRPCTELGTDPEGNLRVKAPALVAGGQCYAFDPTASAACQEPLVGKRGETSAVDTGDYPGGYYSFMHLFVGKSVVKSVLMMRMANVIIAALLLTAIGLASASGARRMMAYAVTVTLVPLGWFIIGSVNPSSWAVVGVTGWAFALNAVFTAPSVRRRYVLAGLALLSALLAVTSRGDAAVYVVITGVAVSVLNWRILLARRWLAVIPAVAFAVAAYVALSSAQVGSVAGASAETDRALREVVTNFVLESPALISGMFGYSFGLGWLDTAVPSLAAYPVALILGFVFLNGLGQGRWSKALAMLGIAIPLVALPALTYFRARLVVGESVQPRYLLPMVPILVGLALVGRQHGSSLRLTRVQGAVISAALSVATGAALYANIRRYVTGTDGAQLISDYEWWWPWAPSPWVVIIAGAVGFALFSSPVWLLSRPRSENDADRPIAFEDAVEVPVRHVPRAGSPAPGEHRSVDQQDPEPDPGPDDRPSSPKDDTIPDDDPEGAHR